MYGGCDRLLTLHLPAFISVSAEVSLPLTAALLRGLFSLALSLSLPASLLLPSLFQLSLPLE